jgi:hypothetical protein
MQDAHFKKITVYISTRVNFLILESRRTLRKGCSNLFDVTVVMGQAIVTD